MGDLNIPNGRVECNRRKLEHPIRNWYFREKVRSEGFCFENRCVTDGSVVKAVLLISPRTDRSKLHKRNNDGNIYGQRHMKCAENMKNLEVLVRVQQDTHVSGLELFQLRLICSRRSDKNTNI